jgi:hypothetical protein
MRQRRLRMRTACSPLSKYRRPAAAAVARNTKAAAIVARPGVRRISAGLAFLAAMAASSANALAFNVILKAALAHPQIATSCTSASIASAAAGICLCNRSLLWRDFQTSGRGRAHATRYSHPRSPNAERSTPGGGIPSTRAIAGAKLQSDLPVAIRNS